MAQKKTDLDWLEQVRQKAKALRAEEDEVTKRIRDGFVERAILFLDVVGSTKFKIEHKDTPERWILRVRQFSELLAAAVRDSNGQVVKFIGDEVMAVYENIFDAQNLVGRIPEVEENLKAATGFETRIKVAADFGYVYLLKFDGHAEADPQGSPVDRCARIGKFGEPGEVLASASFAEKTPKLKWAKVGSTEMKGLGPQTVFQLERTTIDLEPKVELLKKDHDALQVERDELRTARARLEEQNKTLQEQLKSAGEKPDPEASVGVQDAEEAWSDVKAALGEISKFIRKAPGPANKYARFVFLEYARKGGEKCDTFAGKTFDELIEANIVIDSGDSWYELSRDHPLNVRVRKAVDDAEDHIIEYLGSHEKDENDLYEWTLRDPQFWTDYVGFSVL